MALSYQPKSGGIASGGGVAANGPIFVIHSTIAGNSADAGVVTGGGISSTGDATLRNSLVAGNLVTGKTSGTAPDLYFASEESTLELAFSLLGDNSGSGLTEAQTPDTAGNLIGSPTGMGVIDPLFGPLGDNGGRTETYALLPGSPAINAGDPSAVAGMDGVPHYDQRGEPFARVSGSRLDMGAYEVQVEEDFAADFDKDGDVDGADFLVWQTNFFTPTGATPNDGDADQDGDVDGEDFLIWQLEFAGESPGAGANQPDASVDLPGRHRLDQLLRRLSPGQDHKEASARAAIQDEVLAEFNQLRPKR